MDSGQNTKYSSSSADQNDSRSGSDDHDDLTHVLCRICGGRWHEDSEDDALMHVNNEHGIREQLNLLVDGRDGTYSVSFTDVVFDSEYSARTYVMREVPKMHRLGAVIRPCYPPLSEVSENSNGLLPLP